VNLYTNSLNIHAISQRPQYLCCPFHFDASPPKPRFIKLYNYTSTHSTFNGYLTLLRAHAYIFNTSIPQSRKFLNDVIDLVMLTKPILILLFPYLKPIQVSYESLTLTHASIHLIEHLYIIQSCQFSCQSCP